MKKSVRLKYSYYVSYKCYGTYTRNISDSAEFLDTQQFKNVGELLNYVLRANKISAAEFYYSQSGDLLEITVNYHDNYRHIYRIEYHRVAYKTMTKPCESIIEDVTL